MSISLARQKVGEAWTKPMTHHLEFDSVLAEAFAEILEEVWSKPWLGNATTAELLTELQTRAEIHGYANYRTVDSDA